MSGDNSGDKKKYTEPATSKLEPSTMEELDQWAEERELTRSQAVRRLIHEGLKREDTARSISPKAYIPGLFAGGLVGLAVGLSDGFNPLIVTLSVAALVTALGLDYFTE